MNRRNFIKNSLVAAAGISFVPAGYSQSSAKKVIVLGAGLSGLSAADELTKAGYNVTVLEARTRPGGRVYTVREPFSDGLYAEAGAARIQDTHQFTLKYVKEFGLTLDPFFPSGANNVTYIKGRRFSVPAGKQVDINQLPLTFTDEEKKLGVIGSLVKYLLSHAGALGDVTKHDWLVENAARFEYSIPDFLRRSGASEGMVTMTAFGHDFHQMSALMFLRDAALSLETRAFFKIRGGNDQLPKALAARLSGNIMYGAPVTRIEQNERSVTVTYLQAGSPKTITGDYVVNTIPLPVMRRIEVLPILSKEKRAAIDELDYFNITRVYLQSRKRFWAANGETGFANTDDPMEIWDYTRDQPGQRGILGVYGSGRTALKFTSQAPAERVRSFLEMTERVFPEMRDNFETGASQSWIDDPWSLGAAAEYKAGQVSAFTKHLHLPEGRIHFAGDHTSPWNGWMNGALESGNRAAGEIIARK